MEKIDMSFIEKYAKQYGFIYQGSEIYGGLANTWDYGPLGTRLKNNIKDLWRREFIQKRPNSYEVDSSILLHPGVWKASGHIASFTDPLIDCKHCKTRLRADNLIEDFDNNSHPDLMTDEEMSEFIEKNKIPCPKCGKSDFTKLREFNLMFSTERGVTKENQMTLYLRPENAQGEYLNYLNVLRTERTTLPFSIGQIGKAFRNEITPGNFTFRTIEFEQMEYQTFCKPGEDMEKYEYFKEYGKKFFTDVLGLDKDKLRYKDHEKLAHYAKAACDIEYLFPFGWGEINGTHNRTDFDLSNHQRETGINMEYLEVDIKERYIPYIVESTYGVDRIFLAVLFNFLTYDKLENEERLVLKLPVRLAPIKASVLPLVKKYHSEKAGEVYNELSKYMMTSYDESGSIGKRYRRNDAVGIPYSISIDEDTKEKGLLTVRDRDTMKQKQMTIEEFIKEVQNEEI